MPEVAPIMMMRKGAVCRVNSILLNIKNITMLSQKNTRRGLLFSSLFVLALATGCQDDDDEQEDNQFTISSTGSGAQEVPPVTTNGTGTLTGTYDAASNTLNYTLNWTGLSGPATMAHFHGPASAGQNAKVLVPINIVNNGVNGSGAGSVQIPDSVEQFFRDGKIYFNVHTDLNKPGEVRGQVSMQN
jgi:hypothetical protein